jgi:hypothetical protein
MAFIFLNVLIVTLLVGQSLGQSYAPFNQAHETSYLDVFDELIKDSYSAPLPQDLITACKNKGNAAPNLPIVYATRSMTSAELQTTCGQNSICVVPQGYTVTMNSNLNLAALMIDGRLSWTDSTQVNNDQWICAGYIGVGCV